MKKRFLLPLITICTIISITIGIASFSYAWLNQIPSYEFTLPTGDYPLIVKTNGYLTDFVNTPNEVDNGNGGTGNLDYNNENEGTLRLTRANFKTYTYSEELAKDVVNVDGSSTVTATKGNLEITFSAITNNIIDSTSGLGIIGNSNNGYALNNKYFYVVHAELNAILNSTQSVKDSTIYVTLYPCNECAKAIIQSGIKKVIYKNIDLSTEEKKCKIQHTGQMFTDAGVEVCMYENREINISIGE